MWRSSWRSRLPSSRITAVIGFAGPALGEFLGHEIPWPDPALAALSLGVAGAGLALGWWAYGRRTMVLNTRTVKQRVPHLYGTLDQKFYFDLTYDYFIVKPYGRVAAALGEFDRAVVDGAVNGAARLWSVGSDVGSVFDKRYLDSAVNGLAVLVRSAGAQLRRIQVGRVQVYQGVMLVSLVLFMLLIVVKGA